MVSIVPFGFVKSKKRSDLKKKENRWKTITFHLWTKENIKAMFVTKPCIENSYFLKNGNIFLMIVKNKVSE